MKKNQLLLTSVIGLLFCGFASFSVGVPLGNSDDGSEYLSPVPDMQKYSAGVFFRNAGREISTDAFGDQAAEFRTVLGYVGYDVTRWLTAYAAGGQGQTWLEAAGSSSGGDAAYGFGAVVNLLNHETADAALPHHFLFDRLKINAGAQYTQTSGSWTYFSAQWREFYAWLTVSIVNDVEGNKLFSPVSISVYAGPVFSDIQSSKIEDNDVLGLTAGVEFQFSKTFSIDVGMEKFDTEEYCGGVHFRF